jgi:hypothetical protein
MDENPYQSPEAKSKRQSRTWLWWTLAGVGCAFMLGVAMFVSMLLLGLYIIQSR